MLETIMLPKDDQQIDIAALRLEVKKIAKDVKGEDEYDKVEADLLLKFGAKKVEVVQPADEAAQEPAEAKK